VQAHPYSLVRVFQPDIQYVVPIFQRRYVWNQTDQWEDLWDDLAATVDLVNEAEAHQGAGAEVPFPSHFMGAIVVDQSLSTGSEVDQRPLIDGQQRLMTMQVLLNVVHRLATARGAAKALGLLSRLIANDQALVEQPDEAFKVWPSYPDQTALRSVMSAESPAPPPAAGEKEHLLTSADRFFTQRVEDWLNNGADAHERLELLARTLRRDVELVVIDLEPGDNAQVIFESLNYGGRELLAIDLVKNHVFFQATASKLDLHSLHAKYWQPFDTDWWRAEVSQGRYHRPRAELFLMHWLKLEHLKEIAAHRLFVEFRDLPSLKTDLVSTISRLATDRDLYKNTEVAQDDLPVASGGFLHRLDFLDQSTPRPVVLQLLRAVPALLEPERASRAFSVIDSYLVRRMLLNRTTANYNRLMLDVLKALDAEIEHADEVLGEFLAALEGPAVNWPTDAEMREQLAANPVYGRGRVGAGRLAMVLRLVENSWREKLSEAPIPPGATLEVEHVLPQAWRENWPVSPEPADTFEKREENREAHVHRLGNLTLVSKPMNPTLSNKAWKDKRGILREHSTALITRRYLDGVYEAAWTEENISERATHLADTIVDLWPGPGSSPRKEAVPA
jgi:uncharacterized protein DUF262/uncharacterized protein DUF1524